MSLSSAARLITYCQEGSKPVPIPQGIGKKATKQYVPKITQTNRLKMLDILCEFKIMFSG